MRPVFERPCAHLYETGGLRRAHVRGHENVLKRLLAHASAFNLGLWMRRLFGIGTPRAVQGRSTALTTVLEALRGFVLDAMGRPGRPSVRPDDRRMRCSVMSENAACTTGC